jgi:tRNA pseudouridine38-40 synthase
VREALNFHTKPHPVAIVECTAVDETFEARFSATARHYEYRILNRRARPALDAGKVWHVPVELDAGRHACRGATDPRAARLHHLPRL